MRIAWFTPFDERSAIGSVSKIICEELQKQGHEIDIFSAEGEIHFDTNVNIVSYSAEKFDIEELKKYDHVIYNMGNYGPWHHQIWKVMQKFPGKIVLHDRIMNGFFKQLYKNQECGGTGEQGYNCFLNDMVEWYGDQGAIAAERLYHFTEEDDEVLALAMKYSLLPKLLRDAQGVFTHSKSFAKDIKNDFYGPVGWAYLPFDIPREYMEKSLLPAPFCEKSEKLLIVSNGIVHKIKRSHVVTEILLENPDLAEKVDFVLIGYYGGAYGNQLEELSKGALKGSLHLLGYQSDTTMKSFLQHADIAINLRYPNSEVCSLSLFEQMAYKNPVIILESGVFGEIPDGAVSRIYLEEEKKQLKQRLEELIASKELREEIGDQAQEYIADNCTVGSYVDKLLNFLRSSANRDEATKVVKRTLWEANSILSQMGFSSEEDASSLFNIERQYAKLLSAAQTDCDSNKPKNTVGIWMGFWYHVPNLSREGVSRFMGCFAKGLIEEYDINIEVWCYEFNEEEVKKSFESCLEKENLRQRIKIITEKNWREELSVEELESLLPRKVTADLDNLAEVARDYSCADVFVPAIIYLDNVVRTGKRIVVPAHDMAVKYHYNDFITQNIDNKYHTRDILARTENLALAGAKMFTASRFVKEEHILKNIKNIRAEKISVVPFPVFVSKKEEDILIEEKELRKKFDLYDKYLFYPSQIRPHKNIALLLEALKQTQEEYPDVKLVLTGTLDVMPELKEKVMSLGLRSMVREISNVSESELFSLYRYAAAIPVASLMEANFPTQATEALFSRRPLILGKIPVVIERICDLCDGNSEKSGLLLFDPHDADECAKMIRKALEDSQEIIEAQENFARRLLSYTWRDAAKKYAPILFDNVEFLQKENE